MKYKTKPCEIEAIQFTRNNIKEIVLFTEGKADNFHEFKNVYYCNVYTLEGEMTATENDYIIRGLRGEYYPCKPYVFEKKYELI